MKKRIFALLVTCMAMGATAVPAGATELVDDDGVQCPTATHTTIQSGVDAASVNEQVLVCNGIYREQVKIAGAAKNGLDLNAKVIRGATIKAPSTPLTAPEALVHVDGAKKVTVRRFIIAGPGPGTVDSLRQGVLVENNNVAGGDTTISDNLIQDIRDTEAAANEEGIGIRVGRAYAGTTGRALILRNEIVKYQRGGVVIDGSGTFALVDNNTIRGLGLLTSPVTPVPAQQGVQVGRGAGADVIGNRISDNLYSGTSGEASFGILVFSTNLPKDPLTSRVSRSKGNVITKNDVGIVLFDAENQLVDTNRVFTNGDPGTAAPDGGIGVFETAAGTGDGNKFYKNDARTNDGLDCEDGTTGSSNVGTGNTWQFNRGVDDSPATLCTP